MKLDPQQTPERYINMSCIETFLKGDSPTQGAIKVFRNITEAGEVFYHVSDEPPDSEISGPQDLETVQAFQVAPAEYQDMVKTHAIRDAKSRVN